MTKQLKSFFESLPEYNGNDEISKLFDTLTLSKPEDKDLYKSQFLSWLIDAVKTSIDPDYINTKILIFSGIQGIGKGAIYSKISSGIEMFTATIPYSFINIQLPVFFGETILIELTPYSIHNMSKSKKHYFFDCLNSSKMFFRKPYTVERKNYPRTASVMGWVNGEVSNYFTKTELNQVINISITDVNFDAIEQIESQQVWAQAYSLALELVGKD